MSVPTRPHGSRERLGCVEPLDLVLLSIAAFCARRAVPRGWPVADGRRCSGSADDALSPDPTLIYSVSFVLEEDMFM